MESDERDALDYAQFGRPLRDRTRGASDFVSNTRRLAPLTEIAILIRTMPYGDLIELAKAAQDSPTDEQVNKTAGLLWLWATKPD